MPRPQRSLVRIRSAVLLAILGLPAVFHAGDLEASSEGSGAFWQESFPNDTAFFGESQYQGDQLWTFRNGIPLTNAPSSTLLTSFANQQNSMQESEPYAMFDPEDPMGIEFGVGAISSLGYVEVTLQDLVVRARVNPDPSVMPPIGSVTRQGVIARWDLANNFYGFHVDFTHGRIGILRQDELGSGEILPGSLLEIPDFDRFAAYVLEFAVFGSTLRGTLFDATGEQMLLQTPLLGDPNPHGPGVAGIHVEAAFPESFPLPPNSPFFLPLTGSFSEVSASSMPQLVFADGFESGDSSRWSATVP